MSFAEKLLFEIANEIGKKPEHMKSIVQKLEENFCDTEQALLSCSLEDLVDLGVPKFVAKKIMSKLGKNQTQVKIPEKNEKILKLEEKSEHKAIKKILERLYKEYLTPSETKSSLIVITKILNNIIKDSKNEKFRKLKLSNNTLFMKLWKFPSVSDLLLFLNFKNLGDFF